MDRLSKRKPEDRNERRGSPPVSAADGAKMRRRILELFGTLDWDPDYDYKTERRLR